MQLHRDTARKQRLERAVPVAAIVGYTNAGKSTLLNALTGAERRERFRTFGLSGGQARSFRDAQPSPPAQGAFFAKSGACAR